MSVTDSPPLPSTRRLLKATAVALISATIILITIVLPAEYRIDPTGIGARLGLDKLHGSVRAAEFAAAQTAPPIGERASEEEVFAPLPGQSFDRKALSHREMPIRHDTMSLTLPPGEGAEIKAIMTAGDSFLFHWKASSDVAVDMHGEHTVRVNDEYTSYLMARSKHEASGLFTAPFDGRHGWYWLNLGTAPVTIQVEVTGAQQKLFRPAPK